MKTYTALTLVALTIALIGTTAKAEITSYDNPDCIIDASLAADEEDNYMDCNTPEQIEAKNTRCCEIEGSKGCCPEETGQQKMIAIFTSMALITAATMTGCFIVFWCNPDTIPWLQKLPCKCCHRGSDEFTELTDLTESSKAQPNPSYVRDRSNDEYAPPERYDMPEELKGDVQDDWWGSPQSDGAVAY